MNHAVSPVFSMDFRFFSRPYIDFDFDSGEKIAVETSRDCWGWYISLLGRKGAEHYVQELVKAHDKREIVHPANRNYGKHHLVEELHLGTDYQKVADAMIAVIKEYILCESCIT